MIVNKDAPKELKEELKQRKLTWLYAQILGLCIIIGLQFAYQKYTANYDFAITEAETMTGEDYKKIDTDLKVINWFLYNFYMLGFY